MNRRRFLCCLPALCSCGGSLILAATQYDSNVDAEGCSLVIRGASGLPPLGLPSTTIGRSGNGQLDRALIAEVRKVDQVFGINPGYRLFQEPGGPNAYATTYTYVNGTRGTILFGLKLLQNELQTEYGGAAIAGIAAHEGGHIFKYYTPELARRLRGPTARDGELHADFLAGYYFARTDRTERSLVVFGRSLFSKGDYEFNNPDHHGTPAERLAAMQTGYSHGHRALNDAAARGVEYVRNR